MNYVGISIKLSFCGFFIQEYIDLQTVTLITSRFVTKTLKRVWVRLVGKQMSMGGLLLLAMFNRSIPHQNVLPKNSKIPQNVKIRYIYFIFLV